MSDYKKGYVDGCKDVCKKINELIVRVMNDGHKIYKEDTVAYMLKLLMNRVANDCNEKFKGDGE